MYTYSFNSSNVFAEYNGEFGSCRMISNSDFESISPLRMIFCSKLESAGLKMQNLLKINHEQFFEKKKCPNGCLCSLCNIAAVIFRLCITLFLYRQIIHLNACFLVQIKMWYQIIRILMSQKLENGCTKLSLHHVAYHFCDFLLVILRIGCRPCVALWILRHFCCVYFQESIKKNADYENVYLIFTIAVRWEE